jgi:hypothetical protein
MLALLFFAGNGAAAGMDFDGIVAGLKRQGQRKIAKKWRSREIARKTAQFAEKSGGFYKRGCQEKTLLLTCRGKIFF